jgi:hypothetical protein
MIPHEIDKAHLAPGRGDLVIGRADPPFVRPRIANERVVIGIDWIDMAVERVDCPVQKTPLESGRARIQVDGFHPPNCREDLPAVSFNLEVGSVDFPI